MNESLTMLHFALCEVLNKAGHDDYETIADAYIDYLMINYKGESFYVSSDKEKRNKQIYADYTELLKTKTSRQAFRELVAKYDINTPRSLSRIVKQMRDKEMDKMQRKLL